MYDPTQKIPDRMILTKNSQFLAITKWSTLNQERSRALVYRHYALCYSREITLSIKDLPYLIMALDVFENIASYSVLIHP